MRKEHVFAFAALLLAASPAWLAAQSPLNYFSDDCFLVMQIDLATLFKVLPQAELNSFRSMSEMSFGFDITERADSMSVGFDLPMLLEESIDQRYIVIGGRVSIDEVLDAAERSNESLAKIVVGDLNAYEANVERGIQFYFCNFAPNLWLHASETGLALFNQVSSGERHSLAENALVRDAWADTRPGAFMRLAGYFDSAMKEMMAAQLPAMGDLDSIAMTADYDDGSGDFLFTLLLGSSNPDSLNALQVLAQQVMPVAAAQDTTGLAKEIVDTLEYSIDGGRLVVTGRVSSSAVEQIIQQFSY
jgi:hypothetical protein